MNRFADILDLIMVTLLVTVVSIAGFLAAVQWAVHWIL